MGGEAQVDAVVIDKILRPPRLRPVFEIGWRAHHRHAQVGSDTHGDHVLRNLLAAAHAGVIALRDNVGQSVVDDDLDLDIGVLAQQLRKLRQEKRVGCIFGAVIRIVPAGFSRSSLNEVSSVSISSKRGPTV